MAQKVQVVLVDDLDGGHADETVTFSLDGVSYEIDLSHENAAAMRAVQSRDAGNVLKFCHWRQIERLSALLASNDVEGTLH